MIEFMVLALPRSGTTWAANWLTTDTTLCLHDPLFTRHHSELDAVTSEKRLGVSCTALAFFPEFVNSHPARKVVLHRDLDEINQSLIDIGLTAMPEHALSFLDSINAMHVPWTALFENPKPIYEYLMQLPFDEERHALLKEIECQPNFEGLSVGKHVTAKLIMDLKEALCLHPG